MSSILDINYIFNRLAYASRNINEYLDNSDKTRMYFTCRTMRMAIIQHNRNKKFHIVPWSCSEAMSVVYSALPLHTIESTTTKLHLMKMASKFGKLDVLTYLHDVDCPWDNTVIMEAIKGGHLQCIRYLHENGYGLNNYDLRTKMKAVGIAARNGYTDCLKYLHKNGYEIGPTVIDDVVHGGHLECLRYLRSVGCDWGMCPMLT